MFESDMDVRMIGPIGSAAAGDKRVTEGWLMSPAASKFFIRCECCGECMSRCNWLVHCDNLSSRPYHAIRLVDSGQPLAEVFEHDLHKSMSHCLKHGVVPGDYTRAKAKYVPYPRCHWSIVCGAMATHLKIYAHARAGRQPICRFLCFAYLTSRTLLIGRVTRAPAATQQAVEAEAAGVGCGRVYSRRRETPQGEGKGKGKREAAQGGQGGGARARPAGVRHGAVCQADRHAALCPVYVGQR
jgi:hypothetical protein